MTTLHDQKRIIALDVRPRSFGFAVFEGPNELLDFGARSFRKGVNAVLVPPEEKLAALFNDFDPTAVVLGRGRDRSEIPCGRYERTPPVFRQVCPGVPELS